MMHLLDTPDARDATEWQAAGKNAVHPVILSAVEQITHWFRQLQQRGVVDTQCSGDSRHEEVQGGVL